MIDAFLFTDGTSNGDGGVRISSRSPWSFHGGRYERGPQLTLLLLQRHVCHSHQRRVPANLRVEIQEAHTGKTGH